MGDRARRVLRSLGDNEDRIASRVALGQKELEVGRVFAEAIVVNDEVERAVDELAAILHNVRSRSAQT